MFRIWRGSSGSPARPDADVAGQQRFDMGLESRIAKCLLLLEVDADVGHIVVADGTFEQGAICRSAGIGHWVDGEIDGVRYYEWVGLSARIEIKARPLIFAWVSGHGCAHRVEFDVPVTSEQIASCIDQTGLESPLPKGAGASVSGVEAGYVTAAKPLHHP